MLLVLLLRPAPSDRPIMAPLDRPRCYRPSPLLPTAPSVPSDGPPLLLTAPRLLPPPRPLPSSSRPSPASTYRPVRSFRRLPGPPDHASLAPSQQPPLTPPGPPASGRLSAADLVGISHGDGRRSWSCSGQGGEGPGDLLRSRSTWGHHTARHGSSPILVHDTQISDPEAAAQGDSLRRAPCPGWDSKVTEGPMR